MKKFFTLATLTMSAIAFFTPQKLEAGDFNGGTTSSDTKKKTQYERRDGKKCPVLRESPYREKYTPEQQNILYTRHENKTPIRTKKKVQRGHPLDKHDLKNLHKAGHDPSVIEQYVTKYKTEFKSLTEPDVKVLKEHRATDKDIDHYKKHNQKDRKKKKSER